MGLSVFVNVLNLLFSSIIVVISYRAYLRDAGKITLFIAIAFALFGFSNILYIIVNGLNVAKYVSPYASAISWVSFIVLVRAIGYLLIAIGVIRGIKKPDNVL